MLRGNPNPNFLILFSHALERSFCGAQPKEITLQPIPKI
jgi:hypothetical protein